MIIDNIEKINGGFYLYWSMKVKLNILGLFMVYKYSYKVWVVCDKDIFNNF